MDYDMFHGQIKIKAGCMGHDHDILARGSYPRDGGKNKGFVRGP
jgi:hypothetical protein